MMRRWFSVDPNIDQYVRLLFKNDLDSIGELLHWEKDQKGRLALILICDQLSRNVYRGDAHQFTFDHVALGICKKLITKPDIFG